MTYLIDTNIFLAIILQEPRAPLCERFLNDHIGYLTASDFTLHSIGVGLYRRKKVDEYSKFIRDVAPLIRFLTLPIEHYPAIAEFHNNIGLDFDDSYQAAIAHTFDLELITLDEDFKRINLSPRIKFL